MKKQEHWNNAPTKVHSLDFDSALAAQLNQETTSSERQRWLEAVGRGVMIAPALAVRVVIRIYQLTFSFILGRTCRHLPTCSEYADLAIKQHGLWAGLWMALARFWRCRPFGSHGFDPVPQDVPSSARWFLPWRYGAWTGRHIDN